MKLRTSCQVADAQALENRAAKQSSGGQLSCVRVALITGLGALTTLIIVLDAYYTYRELKDYFFK